MHYLFERKIIYLRKDERNEETSYCNSNRGSGRCRTGDRGESIASDEVFQIAVCVIVGDRKILEKAIEITGENLKINEIKEPDEAVDEKGVLNLIDLDNVDMDTFAYGKVSGMCGKAAYEYIAKSIELANAGQVDAVATTPINKESLHAAEVPYIGHTEIFGALTHTEDPLTMFETNGMRVFFLTRHVSLRQMLDMIKKDRIIDYVKRCTKALERLGVKEGTMGNCRIESAQWRTRTLWLGRS